jgi:small subunit ribosomal protein S4
MARYTGPKLELLVNLAKQYSEMTKLRKKKLPGQHGMAKRGKKSEYAIQLMEKQKAKYSYGILEKQWFIQKHQLLSYW